MNQQLKELEKQATTVIEGWSDESGTTRYYEFNREKFAELIVRECAQVCQALPPLGPYKAVQVATLQDASTHILEHFGVKA